MSKVKGEIYDLNKTKLRHNLRRVETKHKKNSRIKRAKNNEYSSYGTGYWLYDTEGKWSYKTVEVPEKTIDVTHLVKKSIIKWNEDHTDYERYDYFVDEIVDQKTIPAHTKRVKDKYIEEEIPPRLIRCNRKGNYKKFIKQYANRICRRRINEDLPNRGQYKKIYDVAFELW